MEISIWAQTCDTLIRIETESLISERNRDHNFHTTMLPSNLLSPPPNLFLLPLTSTSLSKHGTLSLNYIIFQLFAMELYWIKVLF